MKLKIVFAILLASVLTAFASYPITICDVAHAQGYALSPHGDLEYYQDIPNPVKGWHSLRVSFDLGVTWTVVQTQHFHGGEAPDRVWYLPDPNYPPVEYQWL
jgi:hypothetical protein